jgi:eukaryotic-like serine/threonine-protein kinase
MPPLASQRCLIRPREAAAESRSTLRVGSWELASLAGEGTMARVYRARPVGQSADRPAAYAVKLLREPWTHQPAAIDMLRREAFVGRQISHPHVVPVLEAHVQDPPYYLVMPWLEGQSLAQLLQAGPLELPTALWYARQTAEGLDALHAGGWMHADVKPANVFVAPQGHVTLLDLGFARRPDETGSIVDRCFAGTPLYIAPEMIVSALRPDIRSDIYSLGASLFEMLVGRPPFSGPTLAEVALQHRQDEPPAMRRLLPEVPSGAARLIRQMLAKEPLRRPQTPRELVDLLVGLEVETFSERSLLAG